MFAFKSPPLKIAYLLAVIPVTLFIRLPYWVLISAIPAFRPRKSWNMKRTLIRHAAVAAGNITFDIGLPAPKGNPDKDSANAAATGFVWVDPLPSDLVRGELIYYARRNNVEPARIYGYWVGARDESGKHGQHATKGERVLYYLHGGGHVMGSAHPKSPSAPIVNGFLEKCPRVFERAFGLDYRVASSAPYPAKNPFPTAVIDALAGYRYLVETLGFEPANIIVCGDSSGGHLANNLVRYLISAGLSPLAPPGAVILLSPTMDWADTHRGTPAYTMDAHDNSDFVRTIVLNGYSRASLLGALEPRDLATDSWLSPGSLRLPHTDGLFAHYPPTLVLAGGAEQTVDGMRTFRDRLVHDSGADRVRYLEYPDAFHDWLMFPFHEPERTQALTELNQWLSGIYGL